MSSGPIDQESKTPVSTSSLVLNENWDPATDDVRKAYPDAWEFEVGLDQSTIDERMIAGQGADANAISGTLQASTLPRLQDPRVSERVVEAPAYCLTYMSMNTTSEVFSDVRVRQAINFAIDRSAVVNASGGTQLADPATAILPPTVNGHKDFDLYTGVEGKGDLGAALALLVEAGRDDGGQVL